MRRELARVNVQKRLETREELRQELQGRAYIQKIHAAADVLLAGYELVEDATGQAVKLELSSKRGQQLKAAAESLHKMLDRLLPPGKVLEVDKGPKDYTKMDTAELLALARQQMVPLEGEVVVEPEPKPPARRHHGPEQWPFG